MPKFCCANIHTGKRIFLARLLLMVDRDWYPALGLRLQSLEPEQIASATALFCYPALCQFVVAEVVLADTGG
jgi:hypothetical protein